MDVPVRLGWLPGEAVVLPGQFHVATGGRSNELTIGPIQPASDSSTVAAAGLSVSCTARTAEVLSAERGNGTATYECTVRGVAVTEGAKDMYILEYRPKGGLRAGSTITFKLLSLVGKSTIHIERIELLQDTPQDYKEPETNATLLPPPPSSSSQMDGIRDLLAQLAVQPSSEDSESGADIDPKRALMAAIAKSALNTRNQNNNLNSGRDGVSGFSGGNINLKNSNSGNVDTALSLLPQLVTLLQQQQQEILQLKNSVADLEALCRETHALVAARFSTEKTDTSPTPPVEM